MLWHAKTERGGCQQVSWSSFYGSLGMQVWLLEEAINCVTWSVSEDFTLKVSELHE